MDILKAAVLGRLRPPDVKMGEMLMNKASVALELAAKHPVKLAQS